MNTSIVPEAQRYSKCAAVARDSQHANCLARTQPKRLRGPRNPHHRHCIAVQVRGD